MRVVTRGWARVWGAWGLAVLAWALLAPSAASAQGEVKLDLERYQALLEAAAAQAEAVAAWTPGTVTVSLSAEDGGAVEVAVSASLETTQADAWVVALPAEAVVRQALVDGTEVAMARRGGHYALRVRGAPGRRSVSLRYAVRGSSGGAAVVPLPPLPSSSVTVQRGGVQGPVEVAPGRIDDPEASTPKGALPQVAAFVLRWGAAAGGAQVRGALYRATVEPSGDAVQVDVSIAMRSAGPVAEVAIGSAGDAVVALKGSRSDPTLRVRDGAIYAVVEGPGEHRIDARVRALVDRSEGEPRWRVSAPASMARLELVVPGQREVRFGPSVPHSVEHEGQGDEGRTVVKADLPPATEVWSSWTETRQAPESAERFNVEVYQLVRLTEGAIKSDVRLRYDVIRDGVRELFVEVPEGAVVYRVQGPAIEDWRTFAATEDTPRRLRVALGRELTGRFELQLELEAVTRTDEGEPLSVPVVRPTGAFRETGVAGLIDGAKVGFGPAVAEGWARVGQDALPADVRQELTDSVGQAFKHVGRAGAITAKVAAATLREVRFDARVGALYTIKDGALIGSASVQVEVKSGRTDRIVLDLPEGAAVLGLTAPSLNRVVAQEAGEGEEVAEGRRRHRVELTQALEGAIQIEVELEQLLPRDLGRIVVPDVQVVGADVQEGSFGVAAETGMEVKPAEARDLRRVDGAELPKSVRLRSEREILLGYSYAHVPWQLELHVERLETVQTLAAVASPVWLRTTALPDGHVVTHARLQVANTDRQFLRLGLPADASVWTVSADGRPVRAVRDEDGALAIPLPRNATAQVEVVYDERREALGWLGQLSLTPPRADILATRVHWEVSLPRELAVWRVVTALERVDDDAPWAMDSGAVPGGLPIEIPGPSEVRTYRFALPVADPGEAPREVALSFAARPSPATGVALAWLAIAAWLLVSFRRGRGPLGRLGRTALVIAAVCTALTGLGWGLSADAVGVTVVMMLAGWAVGRWSRRREEAA